MGKIEVGKIIGTFGIKGELKVKSESDFIAERFRKGQELLLAQGKMLPIRITSSRLHKGQVLITINNLDNINLVLPYVGSTLYARKDAPVVLESNEYHVDTLIGCDVYTTKGDYLGKVKDILILPGRSVLEVIETKRVLIPFAKEFVKEIKDGRIVIEEIEGMR